MLCIVAIPIGAFRVGMLGTCDRGIVSPLDAADLTAGSHSAYLADCPDKAHTRMILEYKAH